MRIYLFILVLLIAGCNSVDENGYSAVDSGLKYKLHYLGDGDSVPSRNDIILAHVVVKTLDNEVLYNSKWKHTVGFEDFKFYDKLGINECFSMLHKGDSASFKVDKSSKNITSLIDKISYTDNQVLIDIKVKEVFSLGEYSNWLDDMTWLYDKEMKEQVELNSYLDSIAMSEQNYIAGIYYQDLELGNGERPVRGDAIVIQYKAYFLNGKEFDNTYGMKDPFVFNLGDPDQVIEGFETGLQLMRKKGKARFIIPSQLAFGEKGSTTGIVPPFATLVYEVELLNIL